MSIAENIKRLRQSRDMTQKQLAEAVGVDQSMICQIERGTKALSVNLAIDVAKHLECDLNELLGIKKTTGENGQA